MQELDDIALLRQYTDQNSEDAFAAIVTRHVNKVYSVALRYTRNTHQAEEITQAVFVILAKKARTLSPRVILSGWLHETARLTAMTSIRSEIRRARREQEAHLQSDSNENESDAWPQIAPLLDSAVAGLNPTDKHAIVLRYFDGKNMNEVGAALGVSEDAAKMRLSRAVEKLRRHFTKRGILVPSAVFTSAIAARSVQAAPATLAKSVTTVAFTKAATASTSTLVKGALKVMAWTKAKTAIAVGIGALFIAGVSTVTVKKLDAYHAFYSSWRALGINSTILDQTPPQVKILPTKFAGTDGGLAENNNFTKWGGLDVPVSTIAYVAYQWSPGRVVFDTPPPKEKYDFITTRAPFAYEDLQRELQKNLGYTGHRETREADVLLLKVKTPNAPGLKPPVTGGADDYAQRGRYIALDRPLSSETAPYAGLNRFLEQAFEMPVIDQTGLTQHFSIDLQWPRQTTRAGALKAVKQAVLDQLGLELVPARQQVELLVMQKTKP